ncbi:hypothetical protein COO60DRAFT_421463 [Scenedesmus sp. NREL 46B-D3]|nr:hypothetical protein COO60DRAFT_421463 [Scenedesmus sp. NREL 46B-D3]
MNDAGALCMMLGPFCLGVLQLLCLLHAYLAITLQQATSRWSLAVQRLAIMLQQATSRRLQPWQSGRPCCGWSMPAAPACSCPALSEFASVCSPIALALKEVKGGGCLLPVFC